MIRWLGEHVFDKLSLGSGAIVNFNGDVTMTHSTDKVLVESTWTTAGQTGRPFGIALTTNVQLGSFANALKGNVDLQTNGGTTGLLSAVIGEITMATVGDSGNYAALEAEITYGATSGSLPKPMFLYVNTSGTANGDFDTYGWFMRIGEGLTAGAGNMVSTDTQTLRVGTGSLGATSRYLFLSQTENIVHSNVSALGNDARAARFIMTQATPAVTDGFGAVELDLTVSGAATGQTNVTSAWLNIGGSATLAAGNLANVHTDGIWDGGGTLTDATISWQRFQCILSSNPANMVLFNLNFSGANSELDAIYDVNNAGLALGFTAGSPSASAIGTIPFYRVAGGVIKYIYLYDNP